jgi:hypothetical protein
MDSSAREIMAHYFNGQKHWEYVYDGLMWEHEALAMAPTDRLGYAAFRKGYEEARDSAARRNR